MSYFDYISLWYALAWHSDQNAYNLTLSPGSSLCQRIFNVNLCACLLKPIHLCVACYSTGMDRANFLPSLSLSARQLHIHIASKCATHCSYNICAQHISVAYNIESDKMRMECPESAGVRKLNKNDFHNVSKR